MNEKIAVSDLLVRREKRDVLQIPALSVFDGEVLTVIGPNGAGKSTLLAVLALLQKPQTGTLLFDGQAVSGNPIPYRRRMAFVFQEPLLLDTSVEGNLRSGLALRHVPRRQQDVRVPRWLERLSIAHLARRPARELSGGEAQRVSMARAMVLEPEVLLLDEPFSGLDAPTRDGLLRDMERILHEAATTTVFVTHDRDEALRLGDRLAVIIGGQIRQIGPPQDVFASPVDAEVAAFVGVENILPGVVASNAGGLAIVDVGGREVQAVASEDISGDVLVCLRPEDVVIQPLSAIAVLSSARNHLAGAVQRVTPVGAQVRLELDCGGFHLAALVTRRSAEELSLVNGAQVAASFKASALHLITRH